MSGKSIEPYQVRVYMKARELGLTQADAASIAEFSAAVDNGLRRETTSLRTLQRHVQAWKPLHGPPREVMFELQHEPGMIGFSDFTELKGTDITINGKPFEQLLYCYRMG